MTTRAATYRSRTHLPLFSRSQIVALNSTRSQIMSNTSHRSQFIVSLLAVALTCLIVGAAASGYYVSQQYSGQTEAKNQGRANRAPARSAALVRVAPARMEMIDSIRNFHGRLVEVQLAKVSTEVSGLVVALPIEVGQQVKGGETLIAQIDKTWIELAVAQTEAEIAILTKQVEFQTAETERLEQLAVRRAVSESELSNQRTLLEQFRRNLDKAVIANKEAKEKLKRTTILAPFDGYIVKRDTGLGELLSPGMSIAEVVSEGFVDARVTIVEDYINRIKIGDEMPIVIDRLGIKVVGKVHSIVPYDGAGTRSFPVLVRLNDREGTLKVGMAATALVSTTDPHEEIVVSKDAVLDKPEGAVVWVIVEESVAESASSDAGAEETETGEDATPQVRHIAKPVPVKITAKAIQNYGVQPETEEGRALLVPGAQTVIEGAERLVPDQLVRIADIDPAILENLPPASGHKAIEPKERIGQ